MSKPAKKLAKAPPRATKDGLKKVTFQDLVNSYQQGRREKAEEVKK